MKCSEELQFSEAVKFSIISMNYLSNQASAVFSLALLLRFLNLLCTQESQRLPRFSRSRTCLYHLDNWQWQTLHSFELVFMRTLFHQCFLPWTEHGKVLTYQGTIKSLELERVNFSSWLKVILIIAVPSNPCCCT